MHDSWARVYDFVYDECFGPAFQQVTDETLALVNDVQCPPARVLDLGAGTGRLAVPLARQGYAVHAIEQSPAMADALSLRSAASRTNLRLSHGDFRALDDVLGPADGGPARWDLALLVFTVMNYLIDDAEVEKLARGLASRLRPDGHVIFDIAERRLFAPALFETPRLHREIHVREVGRDIFAYRDTACGTFQGERFEYDELFSFRHWRAEDALWLFAQQGLVLVREETPRLRQTGSRWFVLRAAA